MQIVITKKNLKTDVESIGRESLITGREPLHFSINQAIRVGVLPGDWRFFTYFERFCVEL